MSEAGAAGSQATTDKTEHRFAYADPVVSQRMSRVRKVDTKPELAVRRAAHRLSYCFRRHRRDVPGSPDLVFRRHRKVVFVHGCFWYQHEGCASDHLSRSWLGYWLPKLARNVERDGEAAAALAALGGNVGVICECEVKDPAAAENWISTFLGEITSLGSSKDNAQAPSQHP